MVEYSRASAASPSIASTCTTDFEGDFLLSSITSLDTICTFEVAGFDVSFTFDATMAAGTMAAVTAAAFADTTRTTLDNCFVGLATGFVGRISVLVVTSDTGFVSITVVVDDGALSVVITAFGGSVYFRIRFFGV